MKHLYPPTVKYPTLKANDRFISNFPFVINPRRRSWRKNIRSFKPRLPNCNSIYFSRILTSSSTHHQPYISRSFLIESILKIICIIIMCINNIEIFIFRKLPITMCNHVIIICLKRHVYRSRPSK